MGYVDFDDESGEARELQLFIDNDYELYQQQYLPIVENMKRRINKGTFDPEKAVKLVMYLVDAGARKYNKMFGDPKQNISQIFPKPIREEVARDIAKYIEEEIKLGNY